MSKNLDVTKAIAPKSDQLNADDLLTGPRTIKITNVNIKSDEQPIVISFEGDDGKPWKPAKTAARCLASIWGPNAAKWIGRRCTLYNDPTVTWAGLAVGGIRVSHMDGLDKTRQLTLTRTRGKKIIVTIQPLDTPDVTDSTDTLDHLQAARDAASGGTEEFRKWWSDNPDAREAAKTIMDELKETAANADADADDANEYDDEIPM